MKNHSWVYHHHCYHRIYCRNNEGVPTGEVFDDRACIWVEVVDEVGKIDDGPKMMNAYAEKKKRMMMTRMLKEASAVMIGLVLAVSVVMVTFQNLSFCCC